MKHWNRVAVFWAAREHNYAHFIGVSLGPNVSVESKADLATSLRDVGFILPRLPDCELVHIHSVGQPLSLRRRGFQGLGLEGAAKGTIFRAQRRISYD
jgi:hypothetical protein